MTINFADLAPPEIIEELNYEQILESMLQDLEARDPSYTELLESDPGIKIMQVCAARELILRQRVNDAVRATLLRYAAGGDLENLAVFYGVTRLENEDDASMRLRTIDRIMGSSSAGPAEWYRYHAMTVSALVKDAHIWSPSPGQVEVVVLSREGEEAVTAIGTDLDLLGASWGILRAQGENDDDYRARVLAEVQAGGGYGAASPALIDSVHAVTNSRGIRSVTDTVSTVSAEVLTVGVEANVYLYPDTPESVFAGLELTLRNAFDAVSGLGWDVTQSWISAQLHPAGVQRVEIAQPAADLVVGSRQAPALGSVTLTLAGRDR
ncbi:MAG: baseplate J/gp47 family protein [Cyanobacteria bacterium J06638_7]